MATLDNVIFPVQLSRLPGCSALLQKVIITSDYFQYGIGINAQPG